ncbi:winged helix-turn-helix transcriptional regulator [Variovorax sp. JS1663]|uniref:winged helix-turn-helix transcriptional regulator n=1 Tax=Variovorax sp. JS1663 TaxID=1851577 RepID=UPI000B348787|nr:hypothetical protein [Variovorax sp. JS1663]OUM00825.1 hypothetical protein A8M77_19220 [Variovorax sp. JS1663]
MTKTTTAGAQRADVLDLGGKPPHVEYALSPSGQRLSEAFVAVDRWAEAHGLAMAQAREAFDARAG